MSFSIVIRPSQMDKNLSRYRATKLSKSPVARCAPCAQSSPRRARRRPPPQRPRQSQPLQRVSVHFRLMSQRGLLNGSRLMIFIIRNTTKIFISKLLYPKKKVQINEGFRFSVESVNVFFSSLCPSWNVIPHTFPIPFIFLKE